MLLESRKTEEKKWKFCVPAGKSSLKNLARREHPTWVHSKGWSSSSDEDDNKASAIVGLKSTAGSVVTSIKFYQWFTGFWSKTSEDLSSKNRTSFSASPCSPFVLSFLPHRSVLHCLDPPLCMHLLFIGFCHLWNNLTFDIVVTFDNSIIWQRSY